MPVSDDMLRRASRITGVPFWLLKRVDVQEGSGTSRAGAKGEFQLMPGTARELERKYGIDTKTTWGNVLGGAHYLQQQYATFKRWDYALAAYNAGPQRVRDYGGIPPIKETQDYVRAIMHGERPGGDDPVAKRGSPPTAPSTPRPPQLPNLLTQKDVAMEGLGALARGQYDPQVGLQRLLDVRNQPQAVPKTPKMPNVPSPQPTPTGNSSGGITYTGQPVTHQTDGLKGYPARDIFAPPGTPFLAPENGKVIRLSGRGGTKGNVFGYSVYFLGDSGKTYYITHLNRKRAKGRVKAGQQLGTVSPWESGDSHAHVGIKG